MRSSRPKDAWGRPRCRTLYRACCRYRRLRLVTSVFCLRASLRGHRAGWAYSFETRGESMSPAAIVTASDSGIGQESAKELAENGFDVGITYRTDEAGAQETLEAVRAAGRRGEVRRLDLTELPGAADVIDVLAEALGGMDVLVNNAGTGDPTGAFLELSYEEWKQVIDTNLSGAFLCAQRAARRMVDAGNGGRIINITSVHEHIPRTGASAYCASKGGLGLLTKVMAMELAQHGI